VRALEPSRRDLFLLTALAGIGVLQPPHAGAQTGNQVAFSLTKFTKGEADREHTARLDQIQKALAEKPALSEDGLGNLVDFLADGGLKVLSKEDATRLKQLIKDITSATNVDDLAKKITGVFKDSVNKVGEVAEVIIRIAYGSVAYASKVVSRLEIKTAIYIVSSDVSGALTGAATGAQLGGRAGAVVCAVVGAVSTSANAVFDSKR
jgi:hypothetical protein